MLTTGAMTKKTKLYPIAVLMLLTLLVCAGCKNPWMEKVLKPFFEDEEEDSSYPEILREYLTFNPVTGTITGYIGPVPMGNVAIPATIDGIPVTTIETECFRSKGLTGVTIPNSVTSIGSAAFFDNQLTSVIIPASVTSIGLGAFNANLLTSVTFMESGITITLSFTAFDDNLLALYGTYGAGTYTRPNASSTDWTKAS